MSILDTPYYRSLVQDNLIIAEFQLALFPLLQYRDEALAEAWGEQVGDTKIFTANGLLPTRTAPIRQGDEPQVANYSREQWSVTQQSYGLSIDTNVPTATQAAVNLLMQDIKELGRGAGRSINQVARNVMFNAGLSGHTVCAGGSGGSTVTIPVLRLNGLTRARRPDLAAGSPVRYDTVSVSNPLPIKWGTTLSNSALVVGYTPTYPGDETGPGTITLAVAASVGDRDPIVADTATWIRRSGGGNSVDSLSTSDLLTFADLREALARLGNMNIPRHADGYYHGHMDSISSNQIFSDTEWRQLTETRVDGIQYQEHAIGQKLNTIWYKNEESPTPYTVNLANGQTDGAAGDSFRPTIDNFAGELYSNGDPASGVAVHRVLITGGEGLREYYVDQDAYVTEAGTTGKISDMPLVTPGAVQMATTNAHIKLIQRAPLDRRQQTVSNTWSYDGAFVERTDGASGDGRYYKRVAVIEHGRP